MKALVWPVATYICESLKIQKNEEKRLEAFEMKGLRRILRVSWTAKKTNVWVLNTAGTTRELLDFVKARKLKLAYCGHIIRKQGNCLGKQITQGTMSGGRRRGRPCTAWINNISTWTKLSVEGSIRRTNDRDQWRKYVHGVSNPQIKEGWWTELNLNFN